MKSRVLLIGALVSFFLLTSIIFGMKSRQLDSLNNKGWPVHTSVPVLNFLDALTASLTTNPIHGNASCNALNTVVAHENEYIAVLLDGLMIDAHTLESQFKKSSCEKIAHRLAFMTRLERSVLKQGWKKSGYSDNQWHIRINHEMLLRGEKACLLQNNWQTTPKCMALANSPILVQVRNLQTRNGFFARKGCILGEDSNVCLEENFRLAPANHALSAYIEQEASSILLDVQGQEKIPANQRKGKNARLTITPSLQLEAEKILECYTTFPRNASCDELKLPNHLVASAATIIVADLKKGGIRAYAQQLSSCLEQSLEKTSKPNDVQVFNDNNTPCTSQPDARHAEKLLGDSPLAALNINPASTAKVPTALAGFRQGIVKQDPVSMNEIRGVLAKSEDNDYMKRIGLESGQNAMRLAFTDLGLMASSDDRHLLPDTVFSPLLSPSAPLANLLDFAKYSEIRQYITLHNTAAAISVYNDIYKPYQNSHELALAATGSGDSKVSLLRLLNMWLIIGAKSTGSIPPSLHLVETENQVMPPQVSALTQMEAEHLLDVLSSISNPAQSGSATNACKNVFGANVCPLDGLFGKTGTPTFVASSNPKHLCIREPTASYPVKLFTGVFSQDGSNKPSHAISVLIFRTREIPAQTDERCLSNYNYSAEIALRLVKKMRGINQVEKSE